GAVGWRRRVLVAGWERQATEPTQFGRDMDSVSGVVFHRLILKLAVCLAAAGVQEPGSLPGNAWIRQGEPNRGRWSATWTRRDVVSRARAEVRALDSPGFRHSWTVS